MPNEPPEDRGHADDLIATTVYEAQRPQKKDFQPWHRPRKQFVRHYQWCEQIKLLLKDMRPEGNLLKYLGLPGLDLLDLRYFHSRVCEPNQLDLRFLGFNSGANPASEFQTELNISLDEVRKLSRIDQLSKVIGDDFCRIANEDSIAWQEARRLGPYDVINLDLCDGFCAHAPGVLDDTHYDAVAQLLALQARSKNPWILLLTTRAGKEHVHVKVLQILLDKYVQNLANCAPFKDESKITLAVENEKALRAVAKTPDGLLAVFLVGLCKWLLGLAVGQHPPSKVEVKSVIGYCGRWPVRCWN